MPRFDKRVNGLQCPGCGYLLKQLQSPRCPECGIDYRAALSQPPPTGWTRLRDYWLAHLWLRCMVLFPSCLVAGFVGLDMGASHRSSGMFMIWFMGSLLITLLLALRWPTSRTQASDKARQIFRSSQARKRD